MIWNILGTNPHCFFMYSFTSSNVIFLSAIFPSPWPDALCARENSFFNSSKIPTNSTSFHETEPHHLLLSEFPLQCHVVELPEILVGNRRGDVAPRNQDKPAVLARDFDDLATGLLHPRDVLVQEHVHRRHVAPEAHLPV